MPDKPKTFSGDEVVVFGSTTPPSTPPDLRILHFNDVYHLDPSSAEPMGGAARFQTLVDYYRFDPRFEGQPELLVFFSGDAFNPSLESSVTKGTHMVPVLNEIGVDVACVGNHDLDFGVQQFAHLIKQCEFPWLLANVLDKDLGKDVPLGGVGRTLVLPVTDGDGTEVQNNAVKVGVIGLGEREWLATLNNIPPGTEYRSATATARELVPKLTLPLAEGGGGAKFVIALTHMREPNDVKLAENCSDIIDLVLGGHDHYYNHQVVGSRGTHVLRSGSDFKDLSYIEVRRKTPGGSEQQQGTGTTKGSYPNWDVRVIRRSLVSAIPENKETARLVDSLTSSLKQSLNKPIGWTLSPLDARFVTVRRKESNLGNFVCDIMRHHYAYLDSDCAIMAGGTIRGDQIYPPGAIRVKDITDCFPFEDPVVVLRATGQCIWDALENGVSLYPALEGRFPQVSGISFVFDPEQPPGKRIVEVKMNGKPLELERKYVVVTRGYMARGKGECCENQILKM